MADFVVNRWWLFAEAAAGADAGPMSMLTNFLPFIVIGILFWMLLIRPESRKSSEMNKMRENLKKNDRVMTVGGIFGTVVNVQKGSNEVTVRIDENNNTRIKILRSAIAQVLGQEDPSEKDKSE